MPAPSTLPSQLLGSIFESRALEFASRPALVIGTCTFTYSEFFGLASAISKEIRSEGEGGLCAVFGSRSIGAYCGCLGALLADRGYVPVNPAFPIERNRRILELSGAGIIVCDEEREGEALALASALKNPPIVVSAGTSGANLIRAGSGGLRRATTTPIGSSGNSPVAYLLFTSGSTGMPKGVAISHENVLAYIDAISARYDFVPEDRFSQNFELTFDLSVHDMFVCWFHGACLCVPSAREVMAPARFVDREQLSVWFSTPTAATVLSRLRSLSPGAFPSLRVSLFCGEPLPIELAQRWSAAAPNSIIDNLYGPTEATIACTAYRYDASRTPAADSNGLVPIGKPLPSTFTAVVDDQGRPVEAGEVGELVLAGKQLAPGYWRDPEKTVEAFSRIPQLLASSRWYRTGDLASVDSNGDLLFRGRVDQQIKVLGYRVELPEVESVVREIGRPDHVVAMGWPMRDGSAEGIVVFLAGGAMEDDAIISHCKGVLPPYMVPRRIVRLDAMPMSSSGKVDRPMLEKHLARLGAAPRGLE